MPHLIRKTKCNALYFNAALTMSTALFVTMAMLAAYDRSDSYASDISKPVHIAISKPTTPEPKYSPAHTEDYMMKHVTELGYHHKERAALPDVCAIWKNTSSPIFPELTVYREELKEYNDLVKEFQPLKDLRLRLRNENHEEVCSSVELKEGGLSGIFSESQLSHSNMFGHAEPLLTPLRHPEFCAEGHHRLMDLTYLVHDFGHFCRQLKPTSRIVLFDLGASLEFHGTADSTKPAVYLTNLYKKFGMPFDHIYAFEITQIPASRVYDSVPEEILSAYHWINIPVNSDPASKTHPFEMILRKFNEDDFIVVKLDIDTPSVEMPLVRQLLNSTKYANMVDQFYFEHHIWMNPLIRWWRTNVEGSVSESLKLFQTLREKGVGSHSWV